MKVHVMRGMVAIALAVGAMLGSAGIASAAPVDPGCNSNGTSTWAGFDWVPNSSNHLYGVRAPVKLRSDGLLCTDSVHDSTSSVWIMIQSTVVQHFVQIGFIHKFNSNGVGEWCRFWETSSNLPQTYDCSDSDGTQVYFMIEQACTAFGCTYAIYDCGTGGDFSNCNLKDASMGIFSSPAVAVSSEAHFWCVVRMMGQGSDRVWYGNSSWATSIEDNSGWSKNRNWDSSYGPNQCPSDYQNDNAGGGLLRTWDSRNTS